MRLHHLFICCMAVCIAACSLKGADDSDGPEDFRYSTEDPDTGTEDPGTGAEDPSFEEDSDCLWDCLGGADCIFSFVSVYGRGPQPCDSVGDDPPCFMFAFECPGGCPDVWLWDDYYYAPDAMEELSEEEICNGQYFDQVLDPMVSDMSDEPVEGDLMDTGQSGPASDGGDDPSLE